MAKPTFEAWRLQSSAFPFFFEVQTRFQDLDPLGHINNVAMAAVLESARLRFNSKCGTQQFADGETRLLLANVNLNYLAEAHFPYPILVCCAVASLGRSSWQIVQSAFQQQGDTQICVATAEATLVNAGEEGPRPLSESERAMLGAMCVTLS